MNGMAGAARADVAATIIIPTHSHGPTLYASVESALGQTMPVEVFIIGDGASEEDRAVARELTGRDSRVRFLDHPKTPGRGELFRHAAIEQARGRYVTCPTMMSTFRITLKICARCWRTPISCTPWPPRHCRTATSHSGPWIFLCPNINALRWKELIGCHFRRARIRSAPIAG